MAEFDVSQPWVIIIEDASLRNAAEELAHYIEALRNEADVQQKPPLVLETALDPSAYTPAAYMLSAEAPLIILRNEEVGDGKGSFSWRLDRMRLEITGASIQGLYKGVFNFLMNMGFHWKTPDTEGLPSKIRLWKGAQSAAFELNESYGYGVSGTDICERRRLFFDNSFVKTNAIQKWHPWITWAARNRIDALVLPLSLKPSAHLYKQIVRAAEKYGLAIEAGGWDLSSLVPRRLFLFHRDVFRMDGGKRDKSMNFCATSPETIAILTREAKKTFENRPSTEVFHLWADMVREERKGAVSAWCSCPSCRAFTPEEQNRIAVNAAADALLSVNPAAKISFYEASSEKTDIAPRPNLFKISRLPEKACSTGILDGGWFCVE